MELAGNVKSLEEGAVRIVKSKVIIFVSHMMDEVEVTGHMVQVVSFVDVNENYEKLEWVDKFPLCDAQDHGYIWGQCSKGVRDLAIAEKAKFRNIEEFGLQAA